jgi:uncharacterized protein
LLNAYQANEESIVRTAAHPRLYDPLMHDPVLNGVECAQCGHVYFPPVGVGCEICGAPADQLQPKALTAAGVVHAVAEVHLSPAKTPTPFTVAEIVLDNGPLIRAMVHPDVTDGLKIGDRVSARWSVIGHEDEGGDVVEPAFVRDPEVRR